MSKVGQPRKFKTVEELQTAIEEYQNYLDDSNKPPTIAGLAFFTGIDRKTLYNYKKRDEYFHTIKSFVEYILMKYEERALTDSTAGLIFLLKNYGYADKQEIDHSNQGGKFNTETKVIFENYKKE